MGLIRRHWPFLFLISLLLMLALYSPSSPGPAKRSCFRIAVENDPAPEIPATSSVPSPPSPETAVPAAEDPGQAGRRSVVLAGLLWSLRHQNEEGSWGVEPVTVGDRTIGRTGITSLVLLSLMGAGYCHLSRDEYDDVEVGPRLKKGLRWLISQQRPDGTFFSGHDDRFDDALARLAVSEAYGMTGSPSIKEPAALSLDALVRLQGPEGSWGGTTVTPWAIQALVSGELSDLPYPEDTRDRALRYLRAHSDPALFEARLLLRDRSDPETMESLAQTILGTLPSTGPSNLEALYHHSSGLLQYDGSDGVLWKKAAPAARAALAAAQNPDGSWNGGSPSHRLVRTSLAELSLQLFDRYSNIITFGH